MQTTTRSLCVGALVLGAALVMSNQGCTAITNTTAVQCTSEQECLSLGPAFAGTTCDPVSKTCVKPPGDQDLCKTNQECTDKAFGQPAICRKDTRKCVTLITPECPQVFAQPGELLNDKAIVIGLMSPQGASFCGNVCDSVGKMVELGQAELSKQLKGVPSYDGSNDPRPLVVLSCHEFAGSYDGVLRQANHLVDVGVPLVIGPIDAANGLYADTSVLNPHKVLSIVPVGTSFALGQQPNPIAPTPILWRPSDSDVQVSNASAALVANVLEPKIKADTGESEIRVAVLVERNTLGQALAKLQADTWKFNGKLARDNPSTTYQVYDIGDFLDTVGNPAPETKIQAAIGALYAFKPHIVAHAYAPAAIAPTLFPLVLNWPAGVYTPYHVDLLPGSFPFVQPTLTVFDLRPDMKGRVFTFDVKPPDDTDGYRTAFVLRFVTKFPEFRDTPIPTIAGAVQSWYDSFYMAAYAIVANRNKPLTGENLAGTLPLLLPPGQQIVVGPGDLAKGIGILNAGQGIDLQGVSGNLDLDPVTGAAKYDVLGLCPARDPGTGKYAFYAPSGYAFINGTGVGTPDCK